MRVSVLGEFRLVRGPEGGAYAESVFGHSFWQRYLDVFDEVTVVARVASRNDVSGLLRVDSPGVSVTPLPNYVGPTQYLRVRRKFKRAVAEAVDVRGTVILRAPGNVSRVALSYLKDRPFGVEVLGDPLDVFAPGVVEHRLRPLLRRSAATSLRQACQRAAAVAYVSSYRLPERYPPGRPEFFTYSSVALPPAAFVAAPRDLSDARPQRLVSVGSMDQLYKGFDVLLAALSELRQSSDVTLTLVGDGRRRGELEAQAAALGLGNTVRFAGNLASPAEVRTELDAADLYVSASRTEGLPRAVIEAMARGLPCVGTGVGGVPELLPSHAMCAAGDAKALAELIGRHLEDPAGLTALAAELWATAQRYAADVLQAERNRMFESLRGVSQSEQT